MNPTIKEANRYVSNAKEILEEKAIRDNGKYKDKKYIKIAGHTAYCGVLYVLDQLIEPSNPALADAGPQAAAPTRAESQKKSKRKSVEHYQTFLAKYDKKLLSDFNNLYNILHLDLAYDGITDAVIIKRGMSMAKEFIDKVATRLN